MENSREENSQEKIPGKTGLVEEIFQLITQLDRSQSRQIASKKENGWELAEDEDKKTVGLDGGGGRI